jgi:hypothetical protein
LIAQWKEMRENKEPTYRKTKTVYTGHPLRAFKTFGPTIIYRFFDITKSFQSEALSKAKSKLYVANVKNETLD